MYSPPIGCASMYSLSQPRLLSRLSEAWCSLSPADRSLPLLCCEKSQSSDSPMSAVKQSGVSSWNAAGTTYEEKGLSSFLLSGGCWMNTPRGASPCSPA